MTEEIFILCRVCEQKLCDDFFYTKRRVCKKCVNIKKKDYYKKYYERINLELNGADALPAVYKIKCKDPNINDFYIGCTKHLKRREKEHSTICNLGKNKKPLYEFIRNNGGWNNWEMVIIESVLNPDDLFFCEYEVLKKLKPSLNVNGGSFKRETKLDL